MSNALMTARDAFLSRFPEGRIELNGRDWGLIDTGGAGEVFLFLPGTLGRADVFFQQIEALVAHRRVLAVSYPSSGSVAEWSASLLALLDAKGVDKVALLGSSLGGFLAQFFAAENPDRVTHLFAANTLHSVEGIETRPPYSSDLWAAPIEELRAGFAMGMNAWKAAHPDHAEMVDFLMTEAAGRISQGKGGHAVGQEPGRHHAISETLLNQDGIQHAKACAALRLRNQNSVQRQSANLFSQTGCCGGIVLRDLTDQIERYAVRHQTPDGFLQQDLIFGQSKFHGSSSLPALARAACQARVRK